MAGLLEMAHIGLIAPPIAQDVGDRIGNPGFRPRRIHDAHAGSVRRFDSAGKGPHRIVQSHHRNTAQTPFA